MQSLFLFNSHLKNYVRKWSGLSILKVGTNFNKYILYLYVLVSKSWNLQGIKIYKISWYLLILSSSIRLKDNCIYFRNIIWSETGVNITFLCFLNGGAKPFKICCYIQKRKTFRCHKNFGEIFFHLFFNYITIEQ